MDELIIVSHADSYRHVCEYIKDILVYYGVPSHMKVSHVANELRAIVQHPNVCIYDGLLGVPNDALELCERIASSIRSRQPNTDIFVPLRLEHWLVRHLVTIRLHTSGHYVAYYDPNGTSYEHEIRFIVGLEHNGDPITPSRFLGMLMPYLPGWTCNSASIQDQGLLTPMSCGHFNVEYIRGCLKKGKQLAIDR